jgi:hypothetical protein
MEIPVSTPKKILIIATVAHSLNAALQAALGEKVESWGAVPEEIRQSTIAGVTYNLENPDVTPEQGHEAWLKYRAAQGWVYGEVKDLEAKTHPNMVPFDELPITQRLKDHLFRATVHALKDLPLEAVEAVAAAPAPAAAALVAPTPRGLVPITYVGKRETYKDALYSGLTFSRGQTLPVAAAVASKMLAHPDVYALGTFTQELPEPSEQEAADADAKQAQGEKDKEEDRQQDHRDAIARMDSKAAVADFVKVHFNVDVDKRKSLDALKAEAVQHVDRFGVA